MHTWKTGSMALMAALLAFTTACSGSDSPEASSPEQKQTAHEEPGPFGKYKEPVTLNISYYNPGEVKWPQGSSDTLQENRFTKMFEEKLNIKFQHAFEVPQSGLEEKLNLLISSNDIPDFMFVTEGQFKILAESDMLEDMTKAYDSYASPLLKQVIDGFGPEMKKKVTYDGKLVGIPSTVPAHDNDGVVWIRKDWLKNVGIDLPEVIRLDDLEKVARAFIEQDPDQNGKKDTFGIQSTSTFVTSTIGYNTLDLIFTSYQSYPKTWRKDAGGQVVYGSILPETKTALGKLQQWYAEGLLDKEFGTVKPDQFAKDISAGKAGISMGYTWAPMKALADSVKNNPKADWGAYLLVSSDGKLHARQPNPMGKIMAVKKGAKHPEAIVKAINMVTEMDNNIPGAPKPYVDSPGTNWTVRPIQQTFRTKNTVYDRFQRFQDAASGKITREKLLESDVGIYDNYLKGMDTLKASPQDWAYVLYQFHGGKLVLRPEVVEEYSQYYGITKSMELKWANLTKLENESFIRIIVGDKPLDYFDTFVAEWKKQGGEDVTKEVVKEVERLK
ncbi:putative aldouronate transport system substrate-binding protein [Paenibacillus sp. UNCCL117]|uniref:extracellular solute-binding protein n=1 Tax=unclassified Paenibacillus TaxID=185978 RepID=UPI00088B63FA|nr:MULTISPECIES: extracellular solute-binding protein [unclassified Paenibacillus]SDD51692.1 putative aldouronate transport system substrate-binding protein [Paenibacillus sp. cl123]SFW49455.1 putative aldouronate transport system substrate-binding protein [Paenibacillus sp. UNCCL117]